MGKMEEIMQEALKTKQQEGCTQFELTTDLLRNLYKFNLTPVTKLVLLELTTHLNENKNGSVVFPSVEYIANALGIGLTATKKAIKDLINEGLMIKSKRGNIKGNYNKYLLTPKVRNSTSERSENEFFKQSDSDLFLLETNKQEKINNKEVKNFTVKNTSKGFKGGNVYSEDDKILEDYAIKHGARNIQAYINTLKSTKSAEKIIKEYKKKNYNPEIALKLTDLRREIREQQKQERIMPEECTAWVSIGKKFGIK